MSHRLTQLARLEAATEYLNADELEVVTQVAEGAVNGTEVYGHLRIDADDRDLLGEGLDELRDALFYLTSQLLAFRRRFVELAAERERWANPRA